MNSTMTGKGPEEEEKEEPEEEEEEEAAAADGAQSVGRYRTWCRASHGAAPFADASAARSLHEGTTSYARFPAAGPPGPHPPALALGVKRSGAVKWRSGHPMKEQFGVKEEEEEEEAAGGTERRRRMRRRRRARGPAPANEERVAIAAR